MALSDVDRFGGPSAIFRLTEHKWTLQTIEEALGQLLDRERMLPAAFKAWSQPELLRKQARSIIHGDGFPGMSRSWNPIPAGATFTQVGGFHVQFDGRNDPGYVNGKWLIARLSSNDIDRMNSHQVNQVTELFRRLAKTLLPSFAAIDWWSESFAARKNTDPRRFAWGAAYYDEAHTDAIGVEKLRNCSAVIKEEWPDDSFWIQTWANPFVVAKELTDQIALDLDLKNAKLPE